MSNIPIVTALFVKFARRRFRRCFIPSIIIIYVATCLRHNTKSTLFITLQAGSPRPEARPKRLCSIELSDRKTILVVHINNLKRD